MGSEQDVWGMKDKDGYESEIKYESEYEVSIKESMKVSMSRRRMFCWLGIDVPHLSSLFNIQRKIIVNHPLGFSTSDPPQHKKIN